MAATNLAKCIQRLYQNRENDKMADFVIESSDGKQIKVHPLILLSRGSDFLEKMLTRFLNSKCFTYFINGIFSASSERRMRRG